MKSRLLICFLAFVVSFGLVIIGKGAERERPNIVFFMADDWSFPHAGILGDPVVQTPHFDRIAREGILFENAFVSTPSCTPSRLSILTGQHHWRLREGDSLGGSLREEYDVYTERLEEAGYLVGRRGKGVWPSEHTFRGRDSFGERFRSFTDFIAKREGDEPFCFWFGGRDPHRPYEFGVGVRSGMDLEAVVPPACLPDTEVVRSDLADYYWGIQRFDSEVGEVLDRLEDLGELENTIVVVSGDNGMPFPRSKATLYDLGTRVPLAIRWVAAVNGGRIVEDFVSLCDLAPTFLEIGRVEPSEAMTGKSLLPLLISEKSGVVDSTRRFVLSGIERHVYSNPCRALRTSDFLYIRNFDSGNWRTGEIEDHNPEYNFAAVPWPKEPGAFSHNIDPSPTKQFLRLNRDKPEFRELAQLSFASRPAEELYDLRSDPDQLHNVAGNRKYEKIHGRLSTQLNAELLMSEDPRMRIEGYTTEFIEGWVVHVSDALRKEKPEETDKALSLLEEQCRVVIEVVPSTALTSLQSVQLWMSLPASGRRPRAEFHPSANWLHANGMDVSKAKGIEFSNIPIFEKEIKRMPMMLLHELAHAYHNLVLGNDHPEVLRLYERAKKSGDYDEVARRDRKPQIAYAMNNQMEYFAETTEAFFGENDFYPFNRAELKTHDPEMHDLLERVWALGER